jgi:hypothetical protein
MAVPSIRDTKAVTFHELRVRRTTRKPLLLVPGSFAVSKNTPEKALPNVFLA